MSTFSDDDEFSFSFSFLCSLCVAVIRARTLFSVVRALCVQQQKRERKHIIIIIIIITINKII